MSCEINEANAAFDAAAFGRLCCGPGRCTASWCCGQCVADTTSCCGGSRLPYCAIRLGQYQPSWRDRLTLAPLRFAFAQPPSDTNIVLPADEAKSSSIPDMPAAAEIQAAMDKPKQKFTLPMLSRKAQPMAPVLVSYSILKSNQSNNSPFSPYHSCLSLSARYISH